ncbi:LytR/AlgR family response regulator transcription factor [Fictibacillus iocasae]|uniref:LytR/AlgR family response regulator transcription factor n=1 Tax=Fictibacillus iocasae TaxID=2715437 RepID=A0ABW2NWJ5_9BACL
MKTYNLLIADDDPTSRNVLKQLLHPLPQFVVCGEAENGEELINQAAALRPDLILLDINMPQTNGINAIKEIMKFSSKMKFIIITGHDEYAVEAFSLSVLDYIMKPVERSRLFSALQKAEVQFNMMQNDQNRKATKKLLMKNKGSVSFIAFEDILFIEKAERKAHIHTLDTVYETTDTLETLARKIDQRFIMAHRSYIINMDWIENITPVDETFRVSFRHYAEIAHISKHKMSNVQKMIQSYIR